MSQIALQSHPIIAFHSSPFIVRSTDTQGVLGRALSSISYFSRAAALAVHALTYEAIVPCMIHMRYQCMLKQSEYTSDLPWTSASITRSSV